MSGDEDFTLAQRLILERASDAELFQAIVQTRKQHGTHVLLAGAVWDWGDWGGWFQREVVERAEHILDTSRDDLRAMVCGEWAAGGAIPEFSNHFEATSAIADLLAPFVNEVVGFVRARAVAVALAYIVTEHGLEAFCGCPVEA